jgi:cysteine desulfurase / selenocysteine lyase
MTMLSEQRLTPQAKTQAPLTEQDALHLKQDFPVLRQEFYGKPLIYLDNGATTQKPQCVIDRMSRFMENEYGTVRRGVYALSDGSTAAFNQARQTVARFINAPSPDSIIFTRGCTEALNLVAYSFSKAFLSAGDTVLISAMEHHANIVPWQMAAQERGFSLKVIPMSEQGVLDLDAYETLLKENQVKLVAFIHVSNVLGTVNPAKQMTEMAHKAGAKVLLDGAQSAPHMPVDVQALDCDFFTFSGHKVYGPTGIGVLYGKLDVLEQMPPYQGGGDMIETVTFEQSTYAAPPRRFESGTPAIVEAVGLDAALTYLEAIGMERIAAWEQELLTYATQQLLEQVPTLRLIGEAPEKAGVVSFLMASAHPLDIGTLVDHDAIAIRTGHHCAQPIMRFLHIPATARASFGLYNTHADIDALVLSLKRVHSLCSG